MFPTFHFNIERWKYNPTFELYVSTKGRIRNKSKADIAPKILHNGYMAIYVYGSLNCYMTLHRVVMLTWRPTPEAGFLTIDHKNHNKRDNSLKNLEWVTVEENQRRAIADEISDLVLLPGGRLGSNTKLKEKKKVKQEKEKRKVTGVRIKHQTLPIEFIASNHGEFHGQYNQFCKGCGCNAAQVWPLVEKILVGQNGAGRRKEYGFAMTAVYNNGTEASF